jgi:predicted MPP superfamily phosphohydrolase
MPILVLILGGVVGANLTWWRWADRRVRNIRYSTLFRSLVALFSGIQLLYLALLCWPRVSHGTQRYIPIPIVAGTYLWSLLVLPASMICIGAVKLVMLARRWVARPSGASGNSALMSRRQMLGTVGVAVPPLITAGLVMRAIPQLSRFRVRRMHLQIPSLPPGLDGMRIAHFSDLHVGRYTRPGQIPAMIDAVNKLKADLVLFTGDLIDLSLQDLPRGIATMKAIDPRCGMAMVEGNHDLIDNANEFDRRVRAADLPLLIDQSLTVTVRNQPVQLLGTRWGEASGDRRRANDKAFARSIDLLAKLRDPDVFPIVLAHHPHTLDAAAAAGFPLVLSGHTHGGQLMLDSKIGFGPLFFRYWSGVYEKGGTKLVVNNGVGNWFPLRVNAPAEIIELVLHA